MPSRKSSTSDVAVTTAGAMVVAVLPVETREGGCIALVTSAIERAIVEAGGSDAITHHIVWDGHFGRVLIATAPKAN